MTEAERIAEWTAQAQSGGEGAAEAFESLYSIYRKRVYYFCHSLLEDEEAAVDATCSVFLYAWRNLRSMPAGQTFYRWICGNAFYFSKIALAGLRGTSIKVGEVDGDPVLFDFMAQTPETVASELSVRRSHLEIVTQQVEALPDADRICVMLYDYARFPLEEVATLVGCSVETVKCRVYNGHVAICAGMDARSPGDGEMFRPFIDKLIRTCGKNCAMPEAVTDRIRAGIAEGKEVEFPAPEELPAAKRSTLAPITINRICIICGFLLAGALAYILYWFMSSPKVPEGGSEADSLPTHVSSRPADESSDVLSGVIGGEGSDESEPDPSGQESSSATESSETSTVSSEASSSDTSSEASSETSSDTSSEASSETSSEASSEPVLGDLPRATENLRLRSEPSTANPNNLVIMIPKGSHIDIQETVTDENGQTWYKARYTAPSGIWYEGYCSADYVQTEE